MAGSTISSTLTHAVTLGYGGYLSPLSITAIGEIKDAGGYGVQISAVSNGTVINSGSIIADVGVYLYQSGAAVINQGYISGSVAALKLKNYTEGEALVTNSGTLTGAFGILGQGAGIANSGFIYGSNAGIKLQNSTVVNTGTVAGQGGVYLQNGTLTNHGGIHGKSTGVSINGGGVLNFGSISGSLSSGARVQDDSFALGSLANYGDISGGIYGVYIGSGSFTNMGGVSGHIGLAINAGGAAANAGAIYGANYGAELRGQQSMLGGASLTNTGSIAGGRIGVTLGANGNLLNAGYIYGPNYGVAIYNGYLTNAGSILNGDVGVTLANGVVNNHGTIAGIATGVAVGGGLVTNYGTIYGVTNGALMSAGSLANFREISGGQYGIFDSGGNVTNYGVIAGADYGIKDSRGLVTNAGTISGGLDAIAGSFITLAVDPGAVFTGDVANLSGKGILELAGAGIGALGGIGTQITGFKEISFATGPLWSIEGNAAGFSGATIAGFAKNDTIVLDGFIATSASYVKNTGLELGGAGGAVTLDITGNFTTGNFRVTESDNQTTIVNVTCFAMGTRIATPDGEVAVEKLQIGDKVNTIHGVAAAVKWIGTRHYDGRFIKGNQAVLPVCINAGAITDGVPKRDLWVSPGHAISIDGVLVHAGRLVNGVSVLQAKAVAEIAYYHIELPEHAILLAENCPAESFMGEDFRRQFQNAEEYSRLYPGETAPSVMCQRRLDCGFQLHAIQRRLRARAGLNETRVTGALRGFVDHIGPGMCFGWAQDVAAPETPVSLDILSGGRRIGRVLANLYRADVASAGYGDGYQGFEFSLPPGSDAIEVRRSTDAARLEMAACGPGLGRVDINRKKKAAPKRRQV